MIDYNLQDLDIMARTVYGESRGESHEGRVAVAWVIRNRLNRPKRFSHTILGVCCQPDQFSCWDKDDPNLPKLKAAQNVEGSVLRQCWQVCRDVLDDKEPDPTGGAQFYRVIGTPAKWADGHSPCATIGQHEFFNDVV